MPVFSPVHSYVLMLDMVVWKSERRITFQTVLNVFLQMWGGCEWSESCSVMLVWTVKQELVSCSSSAQLYSVVGCNNTKSLWVWETLWSVETIERRVSSVSAWLAHLNISHNSALLWCVSPWWWVVVVSEFLINSMKKSAGDIVSHFYPSQLILNV